MENAFALTPEKILVALLFGALSAYLAYKREKNPYKWFILGFLFGVFGLFAIFFLSPQKKKQNPIEQPAIPIILGPSDKLWYYLDPEHKQQGPMSHHALICALKEGKISLTTYVWNEDLIDWKPLEDFTNHKKQST